MQKAHDASKNDYWRNRPLMTSPINQDNLNRMEVSTDVIDDRVIVLDLTKANQSDLLLTVKTVTYAPLTGTFTFTHFNGVETTIDTDIEKIAINFDYDDDPTSPHYQQLIIELDDGTYKYVDLSALITEYEFINTSTIAWTVESDGSIKANIPDGSVTETKLQPNFLADCRAAKTAAETAQTGAETAELVSEGWAKGTQNGTPVTSESPYYHNNSKYYAEEASASGGHVIVNEAGTAMTRRTRLQFTGGAVVTDDLQDDTTLVTIEGGGHTLLNQAGTALTQRRNMHFLDATLTDDSTNDETEIEVIKQITSSQLASAPDGIYQTTDESDNPSLDFVHTFTIATSAWVANTGSDATDFPYVAEISTNLYGVNFHPSEVLLLGATPDDYPTSAELDEIAKVDMYIKFTGTVIRLRATDEPGAAMSLVINS